ncbi:MAG TPA: hypothetical protein PKX16_04840 [Kiritimatiellia bacterium]|nr:hypothetical protein [Kiritimatiellia bacterium]
MKDMTILNKDALPKWHGPYLHLVYRKTPLRAKDAWPSRREYEKDVFFDFSDDLVVAFCSLTKIYAPFDLWTVTNLSKAAELRKVENAFKRWAKIIGMLDGKALYNLGKSIYRAPGQGRGPAASIIRRDLLETLNFIIEQFKKARLNGHTITIIGI